MWIGSSGYSCYRHWITVGPPGWELGESANCLMFILAVSVPSRPASWWCCAGRPLERVRVAAMGALGVAALAAGALQFFHPFDVTFIDLGRASRRNRAYRWRRVGGRTFSVRSRLGPV